MVIPENTAVAAPRATHTGFNTKKGMRMVPKTILLLESFKIFSFNAGVLSF